MNMYHSDEESEYSQTESLLHKERILKLAALPRSSYSAPVRRWGPWFIHAILLSISLSLFLCSLYRSQPSIECIRKHSSWSPGLDFVDDDYQNLRWNTSYTSPSPYRGPPNADVDRAWNRFTHLGPMSISEETLEKINASKSSVILPPESGGGFMALPEFVHQLHCVKVLWMNTYPEYYTKEYARSQSHPRAWHEHADHCAEILRQKLMCNADVTLMTYSWLEGHRLPHPNFNVQHRCRNIEAVWEWAAANQADAPPGDDILRPSDRPYHEFKEPPFDLDDIGVVIDPRVVS